MSHDFQLSYYQLYPPNSTELYDCIGENLASSHHGHTSPQVFAGLAIAGVSALALSLLGAVSNTALQMVNSRCPSLTSWWPAGRYRPLGVVLAKSAYHLFINAAALAVPAITIAHEKLLVGPRNPDSLYNSVYLPCATPAGYSGYYCNLAQPSPPCFEPGQICTPGSCMLIWIVGEAINGRLLRGVFLRSLPALTYAIVYLGCNTMRLSFFIRNGYEDLTMENHEEDMTEIFEEIDDDEAEDVETQPIIVQKLLTQGLGFTEESKLLRKAKEEKAVLGRRAFCVASAITFVALPLLAGGSMFILLQKINLERNRYVEASTVMKECANNCSFGFSLPWVVGWPYPNP